MTLNSSMFSSESSEWETPDWLFDYYNWIYNFTLDVCASHENHKTAMYLTKDDDGLKGSVSWKDHRCWMNPPYGRGISNWMEKALRESARGALVVCLVPARTDTRWWQAFVAREADYIEYLPGRLTFKGAKSSAPFPSAVVTYLPFLGPRKGWERLA